MKSNDLLTKLIECNREFFNMNRISGTGRVPDEPKIFVNTEKGLFTVSTITVDPTIGLIIEL